MGNFTRNIDDKRKIRRVTVPVLVDEENVDQAEAIISASSADITGELTNIAASSGLAEITVTLEGPNVDAEAVKKILRDGGLSFATKRPKLDRDPTDQEG
jgi:glutathionyl-hydroquinone reductase